MINWKNTAENAFIALIFICIGAFIGYTASVKTAEVTTTRILKANNEIIMEAIKRETTSIKNEISNSFETKIGKQKVKGGSQNTMTTNPLIDNNTDMDADLFQVKEEKEEIIPPRPTGVGKWKQKKEWDQKYGSKK